MTEVNYENIEKRFRNSSQQWIMPIPVLEDGELKIMCFMNHDKEHRIADDEPISFDSYYTYRVSLLVLHNFLLEKSCGKAYWKYVRCKEPRTSFDGLDNFKRDMHITQSSINQIMKTGKTESIFKMIEKKFNDINHQFTTDKDDGNDDLMDMGYDY